jgi:hypothetical protein
MYVGGGLPVVYSQPYIAFINSIGEWKLSHFITKKVNLSTQISKTKKTTKYIGKVEQYKCMSTYLHKKQYIYNGGWTSN